MSALDNRWLRTMFSEPRKSGDVWPDWYRRLNSEAYNIRYRLGQRTFSHRCCAAVHGCTAAGGTTELTGSTGGATGRGRWRTLSSTSTRRTGLIGHMTGILGERAQVNSWHGRHEDGAGLNPLLPESPRRRRSKRRRSGSGTPKRKQRDRASPMRSRFK